MDLKTIESIADNEPEKVNDVIKTEILEELDIKEESFPTNIKTEESLLDLAGKLEFKEECESLSSFSDPKVESAEDRIGLKKEIQDPDSLESSNSPLYRYEKSRPSISGDQKDNKRFICIFCNKAYNYLSHLKKHMRTHSGEKPYTCEICYKDFRCKGTLKVHYLTHTGFKPFKCQICAKEFRTSSNLKNHKLVHTDEKPSTCDICHRKYKCTTQMKTHRMQHLAEKKYHCSFCEEKFGYLVALKTHLLKHTGELPPFKCDICDKSFKMSHHLKRHKETHIGAPFVCRKCNREFLQLRELQKHSSACRNISFGNLDYR